MNENNLNNLQLDKKTISIKLLSDDDSDEKEYWLSRSPQERVQHIERLRQINYGSQTRARLQRVLEIDQF